MLGEGIAMIGNRFSDITSDDRVGAVTVTSESLQNLAATFKRAAARVASAQANFATVGDQTMNFVDNPFGSGEFTDRVYTPSYHSAQSILTSMQEILNAYAAVLNFTAQLWDTTDSSAARHLR